MKKLIIGLLLLLIFMMSGCGKESEETNNPYMDEHVISENIISETILWENVLTETYD